jgi:hypothetical protein
MKGGRSALIGGAMRARPSSPSELLRGGKPPGRWNTGCKRGKQTAPDSTYKAFHPGRLGRGQQISDATEPSRKRPTSRSVGWLWR